MEMAYGAKRGAKDEKEKLKRFPVEFTGTELDTSNALCDHRTTIFRIPRE